MKINQIFLTVLIILLTLPSTYSKVKKGKKVPSSQPALAYCEDNTYVVNYWFIAKKMSKFSQGDICELKSKFLAKDEEYSCDDIVRYVLSDPELAVKNRDNIYQKLPEDKKNFFTSVLYNVISNDESFLKEKIAAILTANTNFSSEEGRNKDELWYVAFLSLMYTTSPSVDENWDIIEQKIKSIIEDQEEATVILNDFKATRNSFLSKVGKDGTIGKDLSDILFNIEIPERESICITFDKKAYIFDDRYKKWLRFITKEKGYPEYEFSEILKFNKNNNLEYLKLYVSTEESFQSKFMCFKDTPTGRKLLFISETFVFE